MFKSIAIFMSSAVIGGILVPIIIVTVFGRSPKDAILFTKMVIYVFAPALLLSILFSLVVSQWFRLASITVCDGVIQGRSYWGAKNRIPLSDITKLTRFSSNGIRAIVVHSKYCGKIYIYEGTERLPELIAILSPYVTHHDGPNQSLEPAASRR